MPAMVKVYNTALYERLSRDDGEDLDSGSILTQQQMLEDFCRSREDLIPVRHYSDDGYSGVTFNRPAFSEMLNDIEQGHIDCVIVKDLSRFGRDYMNMGNYLERVFPRLGIRFIAVNEKIDSLNGEYTMFLPLANLFNTQYTKDISQKVRSSIRTKQQSGCFTGAHAPYGYIKASTNHNHLVIDEVVAPIVKKIFQMYLSGTGKTAIASILNKEGISSPGVYKSSGKQIKDTQPVTPWSLFSVDKILKNPVYAGDMPVGKTTRNGVCGKKQLNPMSEWEIVKNTHAPIIDREIWNAAQKTLADRSKNVFRGFNSKGLFSGILFCSDCGSRMISVNVCNKRTYYCRRYKTCGSSACSSHHIDEAKLKEIVLKDINLQLQQIKNIEFILDKADRAESSKEESAILSKRLASLLTAKQKLYEDYKDNKIDIEKYRTCKIEIDDKVSTTRTRLSELLDISAKKSRWINTFKEKSSLTELTRTTLETTIERIIIGPSNTIEIWYKWK